MGPHKKRRKRSVSTSDDSGDDKKRRKKKKQSESSTKKKHKHVSSSSSSSSTSSSSSSSSSSSTDSEEERRLRKKKKLKRLQKKAKTEKSSGPEIEDQSTDIPLDLMARSKAMAPMTKEEWDKRQSVVRRVYDESTGRHRLIKGDGEVIEEIVSRDRHKAINQAATRGDGEFFQSCVSSQLKK